MSKHKCYAVVKGRKPGIYGQWFGLDGAETQINGFPGAVYKGFSSQGEAEDWFRKQLHSKNSQDRPDRQKGTPTGKTHRKEDHAAISEEPHKAALDDGKTVIYADGGCIRNPGPGGYGVVLLHGEGREESSGGYRRTTNNRMELTACIKGLEMVREGASVIIFSDSRYVVNGIEKGWAERWKQNDWYRTDSEKAENSDLWAQLLDLCNHNEVRLVWLKGHSGTTENERCDRLSYEMAHRTDLPPDPGFETR
jgi:ribonuclease HI